RTCAWTTGISCWPANASTRRTAGSKPATGSRRERTSSLARARATAAEDVRFMRVALRLARRGQGAVEPNPMVGCVLVRGGRVIGSGWHRRFGGPHAEREALRRCAGSPRGATAYVTLEPCCHEGKTPPCTDALIAAGVARVVAAMRDPDSRV